MFKAHWYLLAAMWLAVFGTSYDNRLLMGASLLAMMIGILLGITGDQDEQWRRKELDEARRRIELLERQLAERR